MLSPKPLLAVYYIEKGQFFQHGDKLLTREQCRHTPEKAGRRYFIVSAQRKKENQVYRINGVDVIM